ncbi:MAG: lytic murein transglycosylase [Methylophaga sp.]
MKILLKIIVIMLLVIAGILALALIPSPQPDGPKPWEISIQSDGEIKVFDIHLGKDTYRDAQQRWREAGKAALFAEDGEVATAEVFFDRINLSGLSAKIVANLQLPATTLNEMAANASSSKLQPSGARRLEIAFDDQARLLDAPIIAITYIANYRPDEAMLRSRFGEPAEITGDPDDPEAAIWQYPASHLSIRLHPEDKPVFVYKARSAFSR